MLDISWSNILNSNAFNFTILVIFFAILMKYLKLPEAMEAQRRDIQASVESSDNLKKEAEEAFHKVEKSLENLPAELDEILKKADSTAKAFEAKSRDEIEKLVASIKENTKKQLEAEEKQVQSSLMKNVSKASVEVAQRQVKRALEGNKELHRKFISDFINSIDRLEV